MSTQNLLPFDVTANRHKGAVRSVEANQRIQPHKSNLRQSIYQLAIQKGPLGLTSSAVKQQDVQVGTKVLFEHYRHGRTKFSEGIVTRKTGEMVEVEHEAWWGLAVRRSWMLAYYLKGKL